MSPVQQRWAAKLIGLNYKIKFKLGVENRVADTFLIRPPKKELKQLSLNAPLTLDKEELAGQVRVDL